MGFHFKEKKATSKLASVGVIIIWMNNPSPEGKGGFDPSPKGKGDHLEEQGIT